jgi:hypothetical protein
MMAAGWRRRRRFPPQQRTDERSYDGVGLHPGQAQAHCEGVPRQRKEAGPLQSCWGRAGGRLGVGGYAAAYGFNVDNYDNK